MSLTKERVLEAIAGVRYPGFSRSVVDFGLVKEVEVEKDAVRVRVELGPGSPGAAERIERDVAEAIRAIPGVARVEVAVGPSAPRRGAAVPGRGPAAAALEVEILPEVRHVVAVASGKGGVGKSTVAVNLAVALASRGVRTGLLDADIYGPSIPLMMGTDESPALDPSGSRILPFERFGVRFMSLGFLVEKDSAVIWRGPMVMKAVEQLLRDVAWGALDVLVVDLPPGTGDAQLTLCQKVRMRGVVIVTTPQDVALADAVKGVAMFRKVDVPVLGIVENMSGFRCAHCGERTEIFGSGGGRREAERLSVPYLGEIPIEPSIREGGDAGRPAAAAPEAPAGEPFRSLASRVLEALREEPVP